MINIGWLLLFINFWLPSEAQGFGLNLIKVPDEDRAQTVCTVALLGKYFHSGEALSGSVLHFTITSAAIHVQKSLLYALHSDSKHPWTIVVKDTQRERRTRFGVEHVLHEKPQCYFFVIDSMEDDDIDEIFESWKINLNWNPLAQFVVYLSAVEETEEEMTDIMIEILLNFMNKKIYNVNIIGQSEESSFFIGKTVFPYHPDNNCGNRVISIETLDLCDYQEGERDEDEDEEEEEEDEEGEHEEVEDEVENETEKNKDNEDETENQREDRDNRAGTGADNLENDNNSSNHPFVSTTSETQRIIPVTEISLIQSYNNSSVENVEHFNVDAGEMSQTFKYALRYTNNASQSEFPKLYIEELYRALFFDKFPKDLSGCPLIAAYRPWEPYIFSDASDDSLYTPSAEEEQDKNETSYNNNYSSEDNSHNDYMAYNDPQDLDDENDDDMSSSSSEIVLNGIEYKMIQTIAERLHISIEMQVENSNLYHLFQQLIDG